MAGVVVLRSNFVGTAWKSAFAESLIGLCPGLNPDAADEIADSALLQWRHQEPAAAARRWAQERVLAERDDVAAPSRTRTGSHGA